VDNKPEIMQHILQNAVNFLVVKI